MGTVAVSQVNPCPSTVGDIYVCISVCTSSRFEWEFALWFPYFNSLNILLEITVANFLPIAKRHTTGSLPSSKQASPRGTSTRPRIWEDFEMVQDSLAGNEKRRLQIPSFYSRVFAFGLTYFTLQHDGQQAPPFSGTNQTACRKAPCCIRSCHWMYVSIYPVFNVVNSRDNLKANFLLLALNPCDTLPLSVKLI